MDKRSVVTVCDRSGRQARDTPERATNMISYTNCIETQTSLCSRAQHHSVRHNKCRTLERHKNKYTRFTTFTPQGNYLSNKQPPSTQPKNETTYRYTMLWNANFSATPTEEVSSEIMCVESSVATLRESRIWANWMKRPRRVSVHKSHIIFSKHIWCTHW